jgi:hypothetical protein
MVVICRIAMIAIADLIDGSERWEYVLRFPDSWESD